MKYYQVSSKLKKIHPVRNPETISDISTRFISMKNSSKISNGVHFIGIGGIGISALAQYYLANDCDVSGSDLGSSEIIEILEKKGARIQVGKHQAKNLSDNVDLVIYTPAVSQDNPEFKKAKKLNIKCLSYPEALGELTRKYFTIAVSGTHGKSTTTAMTALTLIKAGLDPTVIVGTKLKEFDNSNFRMGKSKYLVIEADEHFASFLNYCPKIIVLTNIEREHLDYYKNLRNILKTYKEYLKHLLLEKTDALSDMSFSGVIANKDDENICRIIKEIQKKYPLRVKWFSLKQKEAKQLKKIIKMPGQHNIANGLAVLNTAHALKIPDKITFQTLADYKGTWRRFEESKTKIGDVEMKIISDYAHHPTEIKATLAAAREKFKRNKIWVIFQPHQYQRTFYLFKDFVGAFDMADEIILTEIYEVAGREKTEIANRVSSKDLVKAIGKQGKKVHFIKDFQDIPQFIKNRVKKGNILLIMGAGDIYKLCEQF